MGGANWLGLHAWRRAAGAHWTERARLLWPVRVTAAANVFLLPILLMLAEAWRFPDLQHWELQNGLAACAGALLACYPLDRVLYPQLTFRSWLHQALVGWGLRFGLLLAVIIAGRLMPVDLGGRTVVVAGGYLLFHAAIQLGLLLKCLRWFQFLAPAGERLQRITRETSIRMGCPARAVWELGGAAAVAFAFPTTRELVVSSRVLELCDDDDVAAICAHEIAHLTESKGALVGRWLSSLILFPLIFLNPATRLGAFGIFVPFLVMIALAHFTKWFAQRLEKRADAAALKQQANEGVYARALEKLYRENLLPAVNINNRQTHPHLYDRMVAAGLTPDFARPRRPARVTLPGLLAYLTLGFLFAVVVLRG